MCGIFRFAICTLIANAAAGYLETLQYDPGHHNKTLQEKVVMQPVQQVVEVLKPRLVEKMVEAPKMKGQEEIVKVPETKHTVVERMMKNQVQTVKAQNQSIIRKFVQRKRQTIQEIVDVPVMEQPHEPVHREVQKVHDLSQNISKNNVPVRKQPQLPMLQKVQRMQEVPSAHVNKDVEVPIMKKWQVPMLQNVSKTMQAQHIQFVAKVVDVFDSKQRQVPTLQNMQRLDKVPHAHLDVVPQQDMQKHKQTPTIQKVQIAQKPLQVPVASVAVAPVAAVGFNAAPAPKATWQTQPKQKQVPMIQKVQTVQKPLYVPEIQKVNLHEVPVASLGPAPAAAAVGFSPAPAPTMTQMSQPSAPIIKFRPIRRIKDSGSGILANPNAYSKEFPDYNRSRRGRLDDLSDRLFDCDGNSEDSKIGFSMSEVLIGVAFTTLFFGLLGYFMEYSRRERPIDEKPYVSPRNITPTLTDKIFLMVCLIAGVILTFYDIWSDLMVIWSYMYCDHIVWAIIAFGLIVFAWIFLAIDYAAEFQGCAQCSFRFFIALFQIHLILAAVQSYKHGDYTRGFARNKFLEAIVESAPQSMFAMYVMYVLDQRYNLWIIISVVGSIFSLGYGCSYWMEFSVKEQMEEHDSARSSHDSSARGHHKSVHAKFLMASHSAIKPDVTIPFVVKWYHHALWISYFSLDFALRLFTIGIFLGIPRLYPWTFVAIGAIFMIYTTIIYGVSVGHYKENKFRTFINHVRDPLALTIFVNILPADIRLVPNETKEAKELLVLDQALREKINRYIVPFRAIEMFFLGASAMFFAYDHVQFCAFTTMYGVLFFVLLPAVMAARQFGPIEEDEEYSTSLAL